MRRRCTIGVIGRKEIRELFSGTGQSWQVVSCTDIVPLLENLNSSDSIDCLVVDLSDQELRQDFLRQAKEGLIDRLQGLNIPILGVLDEQDYSHDLARWMVELQGDWFVVVTREEVGPEPGRLNEKINLLLRKAGRVENREALLITHGTDTMAWAFAYLRYALFHLKMNIALTGSQLPLAGTFALSDALGNLRTSVYLLNRLAPARLFMVFNEGRHVYAGSLNKIRKWDQNAFDGRLVGAVGAEAVDFFDQEWVSIAYAEQRLEKLHLIRTGGTIESASGESGSLAPGADYVSQYLQSTLSSQFEELVDHEELHISRDSSNISLEEWRSLAELAVKISGCRADTQFDPTVKVVYANPFMTTCDYLQQFESCNQGIVLAGYGAGNANTLEFSGRSVLPAIHQATRQGKLVVLSSQVPLESYDMDYQVGRELVQAGGLPCGDLSLADAQIKLSYLMGHRQVIEKAAADAGLEVIQVITAAFLAGVRLRKKSSRAWLADELVRQGRPAPYLVLRENTKDPFEGQDFQNGLAQVIELLG